ncbi:NAD(P)/FAD-dependent oxidoreductase [uncultured Chitinophaga sp.]|uniref:NAD(P)/FAD-dependent oxidoreductase n=1 Tax=uncultured Chitinophaga sp. TaxID=339340 RepID=UPI0025FCEA47|nr:NAD(P)/FAD-dependent oxidoreductase [uncultured Chitinophaga sp.]
MLLNLEKIAQTDKKRVVIIGGGFAGLELAKTLEKTDLQIVLIDKHNYHTFQPLLYQVATAGLEASSIIHPYRRIMQDQENFFFRMAEAQSVDTETQTLETSIGFIRYDYLVIATGATANFYGNKELQEKAISLKSIEDALLLRNTIISNFEKALQVNDEEQLNSLMDFVIVGGGPTGVEIAGALSELRKHVFPKGFRELDFVNMDIHLIQSGPDLLKGMSPVASRKAKQYLDEFGVTVWLNRRVKSFDGYKVTLDNGEQLCSRILIWAAGVTGAPVKGIKDECMVSGNRYKVDQFNRVVCYDNIFAIGDIAAMISPEYPDGCPMLAQPAIQQGRNLGNNIIRYQAGKKPKPFKYNDRGSMATIGRNKAVADLKIFNREIRTQGFRAWLIWMFIHLISIIGFRNRLVVLINWVWKYLRYDAGIGVIIGERKENKPVEESVEKARI